MNKAIVASLASLTLALGLVACAEEPAPVEAAPEAPEGLTVTDARLNIPAASGNPAALYFTLTNASGELLMLRAANVAGAESASLHGTSEYAGQMTMPELIQIPVAAGETVEFEPGAKHVMVMGLPDGLEPGAEIEVTLSFLRGDKISFPAKLLAPGDDGGF